MSFIARFVEMKKSILLKDFFNNSVTAEQVSKSISDDCLDSLKFVVDDNKPWLYDPTRDLYISIKCKLYKKSGFSDSCCDPKYVPVEEVKYEIPVSDIHQKYGRFYSIYEIDDEDEREEITFLKKAKCYNTIKEVEKSRGGTIAELFGKAEY